MHRPILPALAASGLSLLLAGPALAGPILRHNMDTGDLARLAEATPQAAELFAGGEAELERGRLVQAEALFAQARAQAPTSGMAARRHCQVLTELGRRDEANTACKQALIHGRTPLDQRAAVGALMIGEMPPSSLQLGVAVELAQSVKRLSDQPFGDAALCEIANRIGDDGMLKHCVDELNRIAPGHYETRRWQSALREPAAWPFWLGWSVLALLGLGTAVHALVTTRARRSVRSAVTAALLGVVLAGHATPANAQQQPPAPATSVERFAADQPPPDRTDTHWQLSSTFPFNPKDPEASVPSLQARNKNPLQFGYYLQDLASEAAYAEKRQGPQTAVKFWRALAKAVPDVALGFRKSCRSYEAMNEREKALEFCAAAINRQGTMVEDYEHYGQLLLSKPAPLAAVELTDIEAVIQHLRDSKDGQPDAGWLGERFACEVGVRLNDAQRLQRCTKVLAVARKGEQTTLFYQWSLAILHKDYREARRLLTELKKTKMRSDALSRIEYATQAGDWWRKPFRDWRYAAGLIALLLVAGGLLWRRRRPGGGGPDLPIRSFEVAGESR